MATDPLDEYPLSYQKFYAEIPSSTDYLNEIDPSIYDEHDEQPDSRRGLSAQQVSEIARDTLDASHQKTTSSTPDPQLFEVEPSPNDSQQS